jgi:hypothetical protein
MWDTNCKINNQKNPNSTVFSYSASKSLLPNMNKQIISLKTHASEQS